MESTVDSGAGDISITTPVAEFPAPVAQTILGGMICEFATVTSKGVLLDTQMLYSVDPGGATVDVSTGLSYPAKAERARRDPRVGLLIEASDGGPVVSIGGWAGVRDADIQANALRYAHDFRDFLPIVGGGRSWETSAHRVLVLGPHLHPLRARNHPVVANSHRSHTEGAENIWCAPRGMTAPLSDPPPARRASKTARWRETGDWRPRVEEVTSTFPPPHLTVTDADGFPLPFRANIGTCYLEGFSIGVPAGVP